MKQRPVAIKGGLLYLLMNAILSLAEFAREFDNHIGEVGVGTRTDNGQDMPRGKILRTPVRQNYPL